MRDKNLGETRWLSLGDGPDLRNLIQARFAGLDPLVAALNASLIPAAVTRYNSEFGPRYFGRPPAEPIPEEPHRLTEFRTRLGSLLEYGLGVTIDGMLQEDYGDDLRLSFVVASQFPDFYVRDATGTVLLRIDAKSLHDESAEYSARFDLAPSELEPLNDLLLYLAWKWETISPAGQPLVYPRIAEALAIPAAEIAAERDLNLTIRGGQFNEFGNPLLANGSLDSNFGKINRIVHTSRRDSDELTEHVHAFLDFTQRHADAVALAARAEDDAPVALTADERAPE